MEHENQQYRNQLKGYLFEIVIMELLQKNQFVRVDVAKEPRERVREERNGFIEFKGRGCWHQIDCPCDYINPIPFSYPLRLLGEVKFYSSSLSKKLIREYIGVLKDIQENYFASDKKDVHDCYHRKIEIGAYFSANGFQKEAEKLAYAHGIKTISYKNIPAIGCIKDCIIELEKDCISIHILKNKKWKDFKEVLIKFLQNKTGIEAFDPFRKDGNTEILKGDFDNIITKIRDELSSIESSFIAATETGVFLHILGKSSFPAELFTETDNVQVSVHQNRKENHYRILFHDDNRDLKDKYYYFSMPEALSSVSVDGTETNHREVLPKKLYINTQIHGITRSLSLDCSWE